MSRAEILEKLNGIFCEVFDDAALHVTEETSAADIEDWDSMEQINILMACEKVFSIRFQLEEASMLACVGDIVTLVEKKLPRLK